jgi:primosomal protein N' (replication factor Y)
MKPRFASVALNVPAGSDTYSYKIVDDISDDMLIGRRAVVMLGNRLMEGYIVDVTDHADVEEDKIKPVEALLDKEPIFTKAMLELAFWMKEQYLCPLGAALSCMLPPGVKARIQKMIVLINEADVIDNTKSLIINALKNNKGRMALNALKKIVPVKNISSVLAELERDGIIAYEYTVKEGVRVKGSYNEAAASGSISTVRPVQQQLQAITAINKAVDEGKGAFLLHGVTGSGKTEVYLQAIQHAIDIGKDAIVLVPEISLTPQMVALFTARFGSSVAVWHSRLSMGEKYAQWWRIKNGQAQVVVGARSAVFAPVQRLGLIVLDEEQESSYKSDMTPKYDAREVAKRRCDIEAGVWVLGSATPSLETYYAAGKGDMRLLVMPDRINGKPLPRVDIVDMRQEIAYGNKSIFSRKLLKAVAYNLKAGQQSILFMNRRGFSTFVSCRNCGLVMKCPHCDISLVYHSDKGQLQCHYCGYRVPVPKVCPKCKSPYIRYFGAGTQRIEHDIKQIFPHARVVRMDTDTVTKKNAHRDILRLVWHHEVDILVGTQMIAKGLDFPEVTLVGVVAADTALNIPDFRSAEDTFQLVTQVAGRAGRAAKPGMVIVQTYQPEHYSLQAAVKHDYESFYRQEIEIRERLKYPPFSDIVKISLLGKHLLDIIKAAEDLAGELHCYLNNMCYNNNVEILGPSPAPMEKIKDEYRWQIILKVDVHIMDDIKYDIKRMVDRYSYASMDINPYSML